MTVQYKLFSCKELRYLQELLPSAAQAVLSLDVLLESSFFVTLCLVLKKSFRWLKDFSSCQILCLID